MNAITIKMEIFPKEVMPPLIPLNKFNGSNVAVVKIEPDSRNSTRIVETIIMFIFGL
jgi:hypothetical protein